VADHLRIPPLAGTSFLGAIRPARLSDVSRG
jgi:hypothetical protein